MIVDAANVDCAYIEVAYIGFPSEVCDNDALCLTNGTLAFRLMLGNDGLCLDRISKCPDRFSLREACAIGGESVLVRGVVGRKANAGNTGDDCPDPSLRLALRAVDAVPGLSLPVLLDGCD